MWEIMGRRNDFGIRRAYILYAFGEPIVADGPFPFLSFGIIEPVDTLVNKPPENLDPYDVSDGRLAPRRNVGDGGIVAQESPEKVEGG